MFFGSDNTSGVHPQVMEALNRANTGYVGSYGADPIMDRVRDQIRTAFEAPEAAVYLVATGTAANALCLAAHCPPWGAVYCHSHAHIEEDECGAPEFYTGGSKLVLIDGAHAKMSAATLSAKLTEAASLGVHNVQAGMVSMTNVSEHGAVYSAAETAEIGAIAQAHNVPLHLDGARLANAVVASGARPADLTWKAGVDAVSFGGTKNGLMGAEAVIFFDPEKAWEFELRRKRAGHLFSKHRYLSAQMEAYLQDDLWLDLAAKSNRSAQVLAQELNKTGFAKTVHPVDANMIFFETTAAHHQRIQAAGAVYGVMGTPPLSEQPDDAVLAARLVCSWSTTQDDIEQFLAAVRDA
ncbi:MAG: threonine aldolase family protein [Marinosulfonomonas sp.]